MINEGKKLLHTQTPVQAGYKRISCPDTPSIYDSRSQENTVIVESYKVKTRDEQQNLQSKVFKRVNLKTSNDSMQLFKPDIGPNALGLLLRSRSSASSDGENEEKKEGAELP